MKKTLLTFLTLLLFLSSNICSHPHVFIEGKASFSFNKEGLANINVEWIFDSMFSTMILTDYDENKDNKFNVDEIKKINTTLNAITATLPTKKLHANAYNTADRNISKFKNR